MTLRKSKIIIKYETLNSFVFEFNYKTLSKKISRKLFEYLDLNYDFSYNILVVDKKNIKKINKEQRNINKITDVLSFPNIEFKKPSMFSTFIKKDIYDISILDLTTNTIFLGDVVMCHDKVISQSITYNHSVKREYSFLLLHSLLHLLGYDHTNVKDERKMFKIQDDVLNSLNIVR